MSISQSHKSMVKTCVSVCFFPPYILLKKRSLYHLEKAVRLWWRPFEAPFFFLSFSLSGRRKNFFVLTFVKRERKKALFSFFSPFESIPFSFRRQGSLAIGWVSLLLLLLRPAARSTYQRQFTSERKFYLNFPDYFFSFPLSLPKNHFFPLMEGCQISVNSFPIPSVTLYLCIEKNICRLSAGRSWNIIFKKRRINF